MKYKYIGTEAQLVEHGFERSDYSHDGYSYRRNQTKNKESDVIIFINGYYFDQKIFLHNWDRYDENDITPYIQDLIDDGLVEVVE